MLGPIPRYSVNIYLYQHNQELVLLSGILYQSLWQYRLDSKLQLDLLDVPIFMYDVVQNWCGFGPKPGYGRLVTAPALPSYNILLSQPP